jgi:HlyD family secretion protein
MKKRYIVLGVVVLVVAAAAGLSMRKSGEKATQVQTVRAERAEIIETVNATGKIQPKTQVKISADVSAKIIGLHVEEGDWVEKGDLLLELDSERYLASVESEEANVRSAQANANLVQENVIQTERVYKRAKELVERNLESQATLDAALAAYNVEVARYQSAVDQVEQVRGRLKQARDALSKTTIYAPMSGTISDVRKEEGEIAIGSQFQEDVILVVADLGAMEALVNVDENDIVSIALGQVAEIEVDALPGELLAGTVTEIANSANIQDQGTISQKTEFEVTIAVDSRREELRPGMTASADIITETRDSALSIPIQSVTVRTMDQLKEGDENAEDHFTPAEDGFVELVFVVEDGKVAARQVETGIQGEELIEITGGLSEGDEVVSGPYRAISRDLKNGVAVAVDNDSGEKGEA